MNIDDYQSLGTHWTVLYVHNDNATYVDSFRVEHIPK